MALVHTTDIFDKGDSTILKVHLEHFVFGWDIKWSQKAAKAKKKSTWAYTISVCQNPKDEVLELYDFAPYKCPHVL